MFDRITFDPRILGGRASIRGMRIPVSVIDGQIAHGASWNGSPNWLVNGSILALRRRSRAAPTSRCWAT